jgi:HAD superfamily hydrolase (TIGR01549 family)
MGRDEDTLGSVRIDTLFLDAGGVLVFPNWARVSAALAERDIAVTADALAVAEFRAKRRLDIGETIQSTDDQSRGWLYFNLTLEEAGVPLSASTDAALTELREYHGRENLWEDVPADVVPTLETLRGLGLRLVVVSNANGRLRHLFDRLQLTGSVDVLFDSFEEGVEKPDPRLFQIALERSGGRRESTLHVGDLYHVDVVGARAAGLEAVLLDIAGLYDGYDCPRIRHFSELPALLAGMPVPP